MPPSGKQGFKGIFSPHCTLFNTHLQRKITSLFISSTPHKQSGTPALTRMQLPHPQHITDYLIPAAVVTVTENSRFQRWERGKNFLHCDAKRHLFRHFGFICDFVNVGAADKCCQFHSCATCMRFLHVRNELSWETWVLSHCECAIPEACRHWHWGMWTAQRHGDRCYQGNGAAAAWIFQANKRTPSRSFHHSSPSYNTQSNTNSEESVFELWSLLVDKVAA